MAKLCIAKRKKQKKLSRWQSIISPLTVSQRHRPCADGELSRSGGWDSPQRHRTWRTHHGCSRLWSPMQRPSPRRPSSCRRSLPGTAEAHSVLGQRCMLLPGHHAGPKQTFRGYEALQTNTTSTLHDCVCTDDNGDSH